MEIAAKNLERKKPRWLKANSQVAKNSRNPKIL